MISSKKLVDRIDLTANTNAKINIWSHQPVIKHIVPSNPYINSNLKTFIMAWTRIKMFFSMFTYKIIWYALFYLLWAGVSDCFDIADTPAQIFAYFLIFLPLLGAFVNNMFISRDEVTEYVVFMLRMDAKEYYIIKLKSFITRFVIGHIVVGMIVNILLDLPLYYIPCYIVYSVFLKIIYADISIHWRRRSIAKDRKQTSLVGVGILLFLFFTAVGACLLLFFGNEIIAYKIASRALIGITVISVLTGIVAIVRMKKFRDYRLLLKRSETISREYESAMKITEKAKIDNVKNSIEFTKDDKKNKKGYAMFNELFIRRHKKLLLKPVLIETTVIAVLDVLGVIAYLKIGFEKNISDVLLMAIPKLIFIMYAINVGRNSTNAMFFNCDNAMLNLRFYRQPRAILGLFKRRLVSVIGINLLPAFALSLGLETLLAISGTANTMSYVIIGLSPIVLSMFFSIHNIVLYYLFQPYDSAMEVKDPKYNFCDTLTYIISYMIMLNMEKASMMFVMCTVGFMILYIIIALIIAYLIAPKTFKLRK